MGAFTYNHFDGTAGTISSGFPTFLGSATPSSQAGAIGTGYSVVDQINEGLKTIADSA
jgi:hypothetical protein